jgi:eukaryotic-like serine/threonine-protein kinase
MSDKTQNTDPLEAPLASNTTLTNEPSPRVVLREIEPADPASSTNSEGDAGRYRLLGEIAHGGMGAILRGRDDELGRDVAVKVLLASHQGAPEMQRRFIEEAQIGGQLQHPGIVPVYELGTLKDLRPFFAMKLVQGRTLADLLKARSAPTDDQPRFLAIFQQVAQTVSYAHARGVIHRDLKPLNVMVGSFGEVQVMDWGLAKVLPDAGAADAPEAILIRTSRQNMAADASQDGDLLGTPAYMPPEQANGDVAVVDRRADVFGLGSILCQILTGAPAYVGRSRADVLIKARRGDTAESLVRLDACGGDADLIALARDCLATLAADRPPDAAAVADRITAYLDGVQDKLRAAERDRAVAEARALEERRRRKLQVGLAASMLALTIIGGLSASYYIQQHQARLTAESTLLARLSTLRDQALDHPDEPARWRAALVAVGPAATVLGPTASRASQRRFSLLRAEIESAVAAADRDGVLLDQIVDIRSSRDDDPDGSVRDSAYADAFRAAGLDVLTLSAADFAARLRARPPAVELAILSGLDDWTIVRGGSRRDRPGAKLLSEAARAADSNSWRNDLRMSLSEKDKKLQLAAFQNLARSAQFDTSDAVSRHLLGNSLMVAGDSATAEIVLRSAQRHFPGDVWINYDLAHVLVERNRRDDAIRFYTAARSLRPETAHTLAHALVDRGESDEAIAVFQDLTRRRPKNGGHWACLGVFLKKRGLPGSGAVLQTAVAACREAIRLKPGDAMARHNLGLALVGQGKSDEAAAAYREAIRLKPSDAVAHYNLGQALYIQEKLEEATDAFRDAIRLRPDYSGAYFGLGSALGSQRRFAEAIIAHRAAIRLKPDLVEAYARLGFALAEQGKFEDADAAFREAIRLKPDYAEVHYNRGHAFKRQHKLEEAVAAYREAIRLKPEYPEAHNNLGFALADQGKLEEATAELREAIRLKPEYPEAHYNLGHALKSQHRIGEAIAAYREAIRLNPDSSEARNNLGTALGSQGKFEEAATAFREAIRLKPNDARAHSNLGGALNSLRKHEAAEAACRAAIRLKPDDAQAHFNLGSAFGHQGKFADAVAESREAIRLKPDYAEAHYNLGLAFNGQRDFEQAADEFREVIRLKPDFAEAHCNLGHALRQLHDYPGALAELRKGHELGSKRPDWRSPSAQWVAVAERLVELDKRLPAVLKGDDRPKDNSDSLAFAQMCYDRGWHAAAARLWGDALKNDPKLGEDRQAQIRYNAACSAALAGCGTGKDEKKPDEEERKKLRMQALEWLKAERDVWAKVVESGKPQGKTVVFPTLQHWRQDSDLAGVRDPEAVKTLPEAEQKAWRELWESVDALVKKAS